MHITAFSAQWGEPLRCSIEIVHHDTGGATVILTGPPGVTLPLLSVGLATEIRADLLADLVPAQIRWIEHVPTHGARAAAYGELALDWDRSLKHYHGARRRVLTPDEIRQLGYEPDEVELVTGELRRLGIPVEHEGADVRIDGYAVSRNELRALVNAARGNLDDFLSRFAKMRELFV